MATIAQIDFTRVVFDGPDPPPPTPAMRKKRRRRKEKGGDPDQVRKSQKERFANEKLVDEVIDLDE